MDPFPNGILTNFSSKNEGFFAKPKKQENDFAVKTLKRSSSSYSLIECQESPNKYRKLSNKFGEGEIFPNSAHAVTLKTSIFHSSSTLTQKHDEFLRDEFPMEKLKREVELAVQHFLFPYICNQVKIEDEKKRKTPFIFNLFNQLETNYSIKDTVQIQMFALQCYITCAARGLYTNQHLASCIKTMAINNPLTLRIPQDLKIYREELTESEENKLQTDAEFEKLSRRYDKWRSKDNSENPFRSLSKPALVLLDALVPALNKDFPDLKFTTEQITNQVLGILKGVQNEIKENYEKNLKDFETQGRACGKLPNETMSNIQVYHKMQKDALRAYLDQAIAELPNEMKVMCLSDLPPEAQEKMLNDPFYLSYRNEFIEKLSDVEISVNLTKEAYMVLIKSLSKLSKMFKKEVLLLEEVLGIVHEAFTYARSATLVNMDIS